LNIISGLRIDRPVLFMAGILLIIASVLLTGEVLESALVSDAGRSLGWGATLFRILLGAHGFGLAIAGLAGIVPRGSPGDRTGNKIFSRRSVLILIGLSILALGLRIWRLDTDLWHDEVLTLVDFVRMPVGDILTRFPAQNQHMLYSILARFSIELFGGGC